MSHPCQVKTELNVLGQEPDGRMLIIKCTQTNFKEAIKLNGLKKKRFSGLKEVNKEIEELKCQVVDQNLSWNGVLKLKS